MDFPGVGTLLEWLLVALEIVLRIVALGVIPGNRKPSTGMAWLLLILVEPIIGFTIFLLVGRTALERKRVERQREAIDVIRTQAARQSRVPEHELSPALARIADLNQRLGALPLVGGNRVSLAPGYREVIALMVEEVDLAASYVHVEFYITSYDEVTEPLFAAMERAAARGVAVRLLFDHLGSRRIPGYRTMLRRLDGSGIDWHPMLPLRLLRGRIRRPDLRNHRKLLVVDGRVGLTGSLNLTEPGYNKPANHRLGREWVELMVRLEGPVVASLNAVFASDWYAETAEVADHHTEPAPTCRRPPDAEVVPDARCQVVPSGPGLVAENNLRMFTALLYTATDRISLTSPYFVPDESLLYAVTTAAQRGVEVELFVSEVSDQFMVGRAQASYYKALLEAGVRIHRYPAPFILHAKHFTIDEDVAVIGSSNMDMRSFALNYEISLMVPDPAVVRDLCSVQDHYRSISRELTLAEWQRRSPGARYVDNVMRLTAALQ
ncbi:cardiolipin synthase [Nocardioides sp. BP30]|uniref:cardiolipin synthase n=1 Tax=Nocardioides sp. BP30 TaxID=3036374 RepID=UPI0024692C33|nr:cardiolipin synthase [Nocardioides sp. BP30]WGL52348.1 cardiolipin synthase [Nocardioides sp. BP30]